MTPCTRSPVGRCSRAADHTGPCAVHLDGATAHIHSVAQVLQLDDNTFHVMDDGGFVVPHADMPQLTLLVLPKEAAVLAHCLLAHQGEAAHVTLRQLRRAHGSLMFWLGAACGIGATLLASFGRSLTP